MQRGVAEWVGALGLALAGAGAARADAPALALEEVIVRAAPEQSVPDGALAASSGTVSAAQLENRPLLRPGEVLESVPGLIVTQHSGDGKANQYFLRGFNLDHGTDFATAVDGVPVNMPTHAHGQGYSDLNFLIPELVERVDYRKGVYDAQDGDFSAAGAADVHYRRGLDAPFAMVSGGDEGYRRALAASAAPLAGGDLLLGGEYAFSNGPWVLPEDYRRLSALLKYTRGDAARGASLEAMGYDGHWRSTDQIPLRAVSEGDISRFGNIDPSDGGQSHRWSVSGEAWSPAGPGQLRARAYALDYHLDLFSDFTYFTDPLHGDQFEQYDNRHVYGGSLTYAQALDADGDSVRAGVQLRDDHIDPVALYDTSARVRWRTVSVTQARVTSYAGFAAAQLRLTPWWRVQLGARLDGDHFEVAANLAQNSGRAQAELASPKLAMAFGPWRGLEYFVDGGRGFHSNDARATTLSVEPAGGMMPLAKVSPLVRASGAELGVRTSALPDAQLSASLWTLRLDSELTLDDDASAIVPSGATRRYGVEVEASGRAREWLVLDASLAWTHARYTEPAPAGAFLPNAPVAVASAGVQIERAVGWCGGAHVRYFGATPLTQDDRVRSRPSLQVSAEAGYHFSAPLRATLSVYNLLDRRDYDVEYYYASQLRGEALPVNDLHVHPVEPRSVRAGLTYRF
jgi:outer membrane receptor protein involved in Fe transport